MRLKEEWSSHDRVVDAVAKQRMNFPDKDNANWETHTNPDQEKNFYVNGGNQVWPDLVVADTQRKIAIIIGEVETESTVDDESAKQWKDYSSRVADFYLYVPNGYEKEAVRLLTANKIKFTAVRKYWFENSLVKFS